MDVTAGSGHEYPPAIDLDRSFLLLQIEGERLAEIGLEPVPCPGQEHAAGRSGQARYSEPAEHPPSRPESDVTSSPGSLHHNRVSRSMMYGRAWSQENQPSMSPWPRRETMRGPSILTGDFLWPRSGQTERGGVALSRWHSARLALTWPNRLVRCYRFCCARAMEI